MMKKAVKTVISVFLMIALVFSLTGCGEGKKAEAAVNGMFAAFKALDFEKAGEYINLDEMSVGSGDEITGDTAMFMKHLFDRLEYEVVSSEKADKDVVHVVVNVTAVDMKPVMADYFSKALQYAFSMAFSPNPPSDEEAAKKMEEMFKECATKDGLETVTNEVVIEVKNQEGKWIVVPDEDLTDALLGGLSSAVEELDDSLGNE